MYLCVGVCVRVGVYLQLCVGVYFCINVIVFVIFVGVSVHEFRCILVC